MKKALFTAVAVLGLVAGSDAHADIIFDSITGTVVDGADGANDGVSIMANSFYLPDPTTGVPSSVTLALGSLGSSGNSLMVYLAPDVGPSGSPGVPVSPDLTLPVLIGSVLDSALSTTIGQPSLVSFQIPDSVAGAILSETFNNEFWVIVADGTLGHAAEGVWYFDNGDPSGLGADAQAHGNGASGIVGNDIGTGPYLMTVQTPEPLSIAVLGVGLAGLGYVRRRRNPKA
jgi:PEP-CTERM motif